MSTQGEEGGGAFPWEAAFCHYTNTHSTHVCLEMEQGFKYKQTAETEAEDRLPWASLDLAGCGRQRRPLKKRLTFPGACCPQPGLT